MNTVKIINGVPVRYSVADLRAANPNVSFPETMPPERLAEWGLLPLVEPAPPAAADGEEVTLAGITLVNGAWTQQYTVAAKPVRPSLSPQQFKKRLEAKGRWAAFKTYVGSLSDAERMEWLYADVIERNGPLIAALKAAAGLTDAQLDAVFRV